MSRIVPSSLEGSEALLPGKGHTPGYGINESVTSSLGESGRASTVQSIVSSAGGKERIWTVAKCSLIACLAALVNGIVIGYSSPALSNLGSAEQKSHNPNQWIDPKDPNNLHGNLFAAFGAVGAIFGGPIAWPLSERVGRQATLMLSGLPMVFGWVMMANAHLAESSSGFFTVLLIGRLLTGVAVGWAIFGISVYISEIASAKLRGLFGNCNQLFITIGILLVDITGIRFGDYQLPYWITALITAGIVVLFEVCMLFTYETPRWYFSKGREYEGIHVLKILRGPNANVSKEIDRTRNALKKTYSVWEQLKEFKKRAVFQPFILVLGLMFFQQFSGINAAVFFSVPILQGMGFSDDLANIAATFAVGLNQLVATFIAVLLVDCLGRKILLVISGLGMAISTFIFFGYFVVFDRVCLKCYGNISACMNHTVNTPALCDSNTFGVMGIIGMVIFIASFSLGWGPLPWSMMSELLPNQVRSLAGSIATFINWTFASIVTVGFRYYSELISPEFAWLTFAIVMVVSLAYVILFVPETKGRSLEDIQEGFEEGKIFQFSCGKKKPPHAVSNRDFPSRMSITSIPGND